MYEEPLVQTSSIAKLGANPPEPVCSGTLGIYCDFQHQVGSSLTCLSQYCSKGRMFGNTANPYFCPDTMNHCGGMQGGYMGPSRVAPANGGASGTENRVIQISDTVREETVGDNLTLLTTQDGVDAHLLNQSAAELYHAVDGVTQEAAISAYVESYSNHQKLREDAAKTLADLKAKGLLTETLPQ